MIFVIVPVRNEWERTRALLHSLGQDADLIDDVLVMNHGSTDATVSQLRSWQRVQHYASYYPLGRKIHVKHFTHDQTIYEMWNAGFARARRIAAGRPFSVLVTNNDIQLLRGSLWLLQEALNSHPAAFVSYPDYDAPWSSHGEYLPARLGEVRETRGVLSDGGMSGSCFMLAGDRLHWAQVSNGGHKPSGKLITDLAYQWWFGDNHLAECIELAGGKQLRVVGLPVKHANEGTAQHYADELWPKKYQDRQRWLTRHARWEQQHG